MGDNQTRSQEGENNLPLSPETLHTQHNKSAKQSEVRFALYSGRFLDRADSVVYAIVGACFLLAAILALLYSFWDLGISIIGLRTFPMDQQPGREAQAVEVRHHRARWLPREAGSGVGFRRHQTSGPEEAAEKPGMDGK